jgi:glycosyltransferase involved in cell wall biosynthesis
MMTATVVIPTRNRVTTLVPMVERVLPQARAAGARVVVVDNGSDDGTVERLGRHPAVADGALHVLVEPALGATRARNAGARAADGEVLAFIDDDATPAEGWLRALLAPFADPRMGAVGGRVTLRFAERPPAWWDETLALYLAAYDLGPKAVDLGRRGSGDSPRGLNMAVRRDAFLAVGGFSHHLGPRGTRPSVGEESDLCLRLLERGLGVAYEPAAQVEHLVDPSRLAPEWFFRRAFWTGWSEAMIGLAHKRVRKVLGLVRWHYRGRALRLPYLPGAHPTRAAVRRECERREAVGYLMGLLVWAPRRKALRITGPAS